PHRRRRPAARSGHAARTGVRGPGAHHGVPAHDRGGGRGPPGRPPPRVPGHVPRGSRPGLSGSAPMQGLPPIPGGPPPGAAPEPAPRRGRISRYAVLAPIVVLAVAAYVVRLPYFVIGPGPARDVEPLIHVQDHATYQSKGHLLLTSVTLFQPNAYQ